MKKRIAKIFGTFLSETETIRGLFKKMEPSGRLDAKALNEIIVVICEKIDSLSKKQEEILERLLEIESKMTKLKK